MSAAVKRTPATPLPWEADGMMYYSRLRGPDGEFVAECIGRKHSFRQVQDVEYEAHAANAYPRLVEALKLNSSANTEALLRELGEV